MLFNSLVFAGFLAVILPLYYVLAHRWQNRLLLVASYVFYAAWDWRFLSLLLLSTAVDYWAAHAMVVAPAGRKRFYLGASLATNLGVLGLFKYFNFFIDSFRRLLEPLGMGGLNDVTLQIILPVGISFYTFQTLAYTIDVYRGRLEPTRDFLSFALYVSYFPQLVAGPIERATNLIPQLRSERRVDRTMIRSGAQLILMGYFKKVAIADSVAPMVEQAFRDPSLLSSPALLFSIYLFALQIYCDFSGYTDIARGVSRLLGIELMLNFKQPYLSRNITEFWRRWHISLSSWLRDYLYIPLGGNRGGKLLTYRNLMLTMLLGGLWHGAAWTFVMWGGLHGLYLAIHKMAAGPQQAIEGPASSALGWIRYAAGVVLTFNLVCLTWIYFRAPDFSTATAFLAGIFGGGVASDWTSALIYLAFYGTLVVALDVACWWKDRELPVSSRLPALARGAIYAVALSILAFLGENEAAAFIYFQF